MMNSSDSKETMTDQQVTSNPRRALRKDVGATSVEYESRQSYLQGARLRFVTAAYVHFGQAPRKLISRQLM